MTLSSWDAGQAGVAALVSLLVDDAELAESDLELLDELSDDEELDDDDELSEEDVEVSEDEPGRESVR